MPADGNAATPADAPLGLSAALGNLRAGQRLDRYELLLPVARGGTAVVWAACDRSDDSERLYAVKTILPTVSDDAHFREMFTRETRIASGIKHPNVCEVVDFGQDRGTLYLVMEWIDGEALSALRRDGEAIPLGIAARVVIDAARGLEAAHRLTDPSGKRLGIVHRDVSPQNILVGPDGVAKIADFGVAKATEAGTGRTQSGYIKGKVDYLSPEQAYSEPVDARADVFALGVVLYEITTGRRPFAADSQMATLVKVTSPDPPASPLDIVPSYPEALAAVVLRALEKDKTERHADMAEFVEDLSRAMADVGIGEHEEVVRYARSIAGDRRDRRTRAIQSAMTRSGDEPAIFDAPSPQEPSFSPTSQPAKTKPSGSRAVGWTLLGGAAAITLLWGLGRGQKAVPPAPLQATSGGAPSAADVVPAPAPAEPTTAHAAALDPAPSAEPPEAPPRAAPSAAPSARRAPASGKAPVTKRNQHLDHLLENRE
jgi:eukaryotic-like serine/threonine-protein kinase